MPFTISHVAAVLPFSRWLARWRLLSATIIGSMVPDFGLLMPWRPDRTETHSRIGLLTFCLPVGLATFWVFQRLVKTPLMEVLPDSAYARWRRFGAPATIGDATQWLLAACGVLVGAFSHLTWDAFTHEGALGVRMIPVLDDPVVDIAGHHLAGVRIWQDISSLVGLAVVLAVIAYGLRGGRAAGVPVARSLRPRERYLWISAYVLGTAIFGLYFLHHLMHFRSYSTREITLFVASCAVAALRGFATALIAVSVFLALRIHAAR
jgi:hypothetical protein